MHFYTPPPVAKAAVRSKAVVLLLLIHCFKYLILCVGVLCWSLFCYALLCVCSIFAIILMMKERERVGCFALFVLWLFTVPWVGLQIVIVVFADPTHLLCCLNLLKHIR